MAGLLPFSPALLILPFRAFPLHLLLLPRRVLQGVLGRPARLRRRRAAQEYRGERVSADPAERPSLLPLLRGFHGLLAYDVWKGCGSRTRPPARRFGIGVGTLVLAVNVVLLGGYTLAATRCATSSAATSTSCRGHPVRQARLRLRELPQPGHMRWAWCSLFWVAFADLYVRLCSMGIWTDWRIF